ncbi:MAG: xanthine dehydrogenase family protein molybdopterin-binding subunit [Nakamurella sp.]
MTASVSAASAGAQHQRAVGVSVPRKEDRRMLMGRGLFGADTMRPGMLYARVVRSTVARGDGLKVDTSAALTIPGVVGVLTADDLQDCPRIPIRVPVQNIDLSEFLQPVLAVGQVRYVGEPVALVLAVDAYVAEDAADAVVVDVSAQPALLDAETAPCAADFGLGYGDVDAAFEHAAHTISMTFKVGRHSAVPLEPRALLADIDAAGTALDIFGATKVAVFNQHVLADLLGWDAESIRMRAVDAGGGFGVRGEFYPEDFLIPYAAVRYRRPVYWVEDRAENLVAVNHSRQQLHRIELALDGDGVILGLRDDLVQDNGAYARTHGVCVPDLTLAMLPGPYRIPAYAGHARVGLTSKTPCGTYRGPGRFEGTVVREQLFDIAADRLGIDRVEFRRRNLLTPSELPRARGMNTLGTDVVLDGGDYPGLLDRALERIDELGWRQMLAAGRGQGRRMGLGVTMFLEKSGLGPHETADVEVTSSGRVRVHSGGASLGQGIETALAQIAADELHVDVDRVDVINGDTLLQPFGMGSWASRSTVVSGSAVQGAGKRVVARMMVLASRMLEVSPDDLEMGDGNIRVRGVPGLKMDFRAIAAAARPGSKYLEDDEPAGLLARYRFGVDHMNYPYGVHAALVEVDEGTGGVSVLRYLVAYEVGRAVNPALVADQLRGGVAQGIGGALLEEFNYDEAGQPLSTTFIDYMEPTADLVPDVEIIISEEAPAASNPLGVRGAGEGGLTGSGAALVCAVRDALGGRVVTRIPMTPDRVLELLESNV